MMKTLKKNHNQSAQFIFHSIEDHEVPIESPKEKLISLENAIDKNLDKIEKDEAKDHENSLRVLAKRVGNPNYRHRQNLRAISRVLSAEISTTDNKSLALRVLRGIDKADVDKWISKNPEMAGPILDSWLAAEADNLGKKKFETIEKAQKERLSLSEVAGNPENLSLLRALPAKDLLSTGFASPEGLRALFLADNVVDFHGNSSAQRMIGAGDFFGSAQQVLSITKNGQERVGKRSIGAAYSPNKIGYRDADGYIAIKGGEILSTSTTVDVSNLDVPTIDESYEYVLADGTKLSGESAYQAQFAEDVSFIPDNSGNYNPEFANEDVDNGENLKGEALWANPKFQAKLRQVCSNLGVTPIDMKTVMKAESGIDPKAVNPGSGATGMIQFMPSTARGLGTSVEQLRQMSSVKQLDFVQKYFQRYAGRLNSAEDLYMVTFFPAALGKPDNWVLQTPRLSAETIAAQNKGISPGKSQITVGDFNSYVRRKNLNA